MPARIYLLCYLFFHLGCAAQTKTCIHINLQDLKKTSLPVEVRVSEIKTEVLEFVIPRLVPGTYWPVHYERFYSDFKAYDKEHHRLKTKKVKNVIRIYEAKKLEKLCYTVKQNTGNKKIWDNGFGCGGTVFTRKAFLLNYALISGYFKGYENQPMEIEIEKPSDFYASTALEQKSSTQHTDVFVVKNYAGLVDKPTLYCKPDTCSFEVANCRFHISVFAEKGNIQSQVIKPIIQKTMGSISAFFGYLPIKDYHFLIYALKPDSLKGFINRLGLYSALEHENSSVYYLEDLANAGALQGFLKTPACMNFCISGHRLAFIVIK